MIRNRRPDRRPARNHNIRGMRHLKNITHQTRPFSGS